MTHTELAYAKLTVHLHMTGLRADGYHLLDSEMVSLDFADRLEFSEGDGLRVTGNNAIPTDGQNLVVRALNLVDRRAHIDLFKTVPSGAGLGGGSSDAPAVLRWAGVDDTAIAAELGADVPFCLRGGRAHVTGVGEILKPLPYVERSYTLLMPPLSVDTVAVYRAFDAKVASAADWNDRNHLEAAAIAVEPTLRTWRDRFREITGATPTLAGSGSTWFVEGDWPAPPELGDARWAVATTTQAV